MNYPEKYKEGYTAYNDGVDYFRNPYSARTQYDLFLAWCNGWERAEYAAEAFNAVEGLR